MEPEAWNLYEPEDRGPLLPALVELWEASVRATHLFLTDDEVKRIKGYVPQALAAVPHLVAAADRSGSPGPRPWQGPFDLCRPAIRGAGGHRQRAEPPGGGVLRAPGLSHLPPHGPGRGGGTLPPFVYAPDGGRAGGRDRRSLLLKVTIKNTGPRCSALLNNGGLILRALPEKLTFSAAAACPWGRRPGDLRAGRRTSPWSSPNEGG